MTKLIPEVDASLIELAAPVVRVTLLEDRALVRRQGRIRLSAGRQRLIVHGVSPVVQDVSLQTEWLGGAGRVTDVRARRAWRILAEDRPEDAAQLEHRIDDVTRSIGRLEAERAAARERVKRIDHMIQQAAREVPVDASWGRVEPDAWRSTFSALFSRARESIEADLAGFHVQEDNLETLNNLIKQRQAIDRLDTRFVGWLGIDVELESDDEIQVAVEYVVPCALWRPIHSARWMGDDTVTVKTAAILWQNTGEDWSEVELHFSTSRASLGNEPPRLTDDPLSAERKDEELRVEVRQVEVAEASVDAGDAPADASKGSGAHPNQVSLAGVDDGGQRRHLVAPATHSVPSDGRPVRIPLAAFDGEAKGELMAMPEHRPVAVWRVVGKHTGDAPLLAGPVELIRDHGPVGWTETRFVAPAAPFELGFGPDEAVRIERQVDRKKIDRRHDEWPAIQRTVNVFLSNLGPEPRRLKVIERIPVSEIDEVRVTLVADTTTDGHTVDDDGFVTWWIDLEGRAQETVRLRWVLEQAPDLDWSFD